MEVWELVARERIRDSLARYNWSGDSLRVDEFVLAFCDAGELEIRGDEPIRGREAIAAFIAGVGQRAMPDRESEQRRIVRHNVTNIRFVELLPDRALVASYFTVLTGIGLDHYGRYRDTLVPVGEEWLIQHRLVSTDWHDERSTMVRSSG